MGVQQPDSHGPGCPRKRLFKAHVWRQLWGFSPLTASPEAIQPTSPSLEEEAPTLSVFSLVCPGNTVTPASATKTHRREKGPQCQAAFPPPLPTPPHTLQGLPWLCFLGERPGFLCPYEHVPPPPPHAGLSLSSPLPALLHLLCVPGGPEHPAPCASGLWGFIQWGC